MGMGHLTVLHVRLGAKIWDLHAKDSNSFRNRLMTALLRRLYIKALCRTSCRALCRASADLRAGPPYADLRAEPPYAKLRADLCVDLRAEPLYIDLCTGII